MKRVIRDYGISDSGKVKCNSVELDELNLDTFNSSLSTFLTVSGAVFLSFSLVLKARRYVCTVKFLLYYANL